MSVTHMVLESLSDDALDAACIQRLQSRGYVCQLPHNWERIGDFARRIGVSTKCVIQRLDDQRCPLPSHCIARAPRTRDQKQGRRSHIASTKAFEKFCLENKS